MANAKRMGRPPKPRSEKYGAQVNVRMTEAERQVLEAEAARLGVSLSALLMRPWRKSEEK